MKVHLVLLISLVFYSCSPINKQHGYLVDDLVMSSDKISDFSEGKTTKTTIFQTLGSPSIEIYDVNDVWIYMVSVNEENIFDNDEIKFQNIYRFEFDNNSFLIKKSFIDANDIKEIDFSNEKTRVIRDAYGITDQLYEAFTRGQ